MQDRYSGDVGDFGKFGLLRHLVNDTAYCLGINWYLFPNEKRNEDGKFIHYLSDTQYQACDTELLNKLKNIVSNKRTVSALEKSQLFRCSTRYFSDGVDFYSQSPGQTKSNKSRRLLLRKNWQEKATTALSSCNVIFLDPDNGLEIDSCKSLNQKKSGKYAYFDEINQFHKGKIFTVIYHHLNRHKNHGTHQEQIRTRAQELAKHINPVDTVYCLRYTPYSPRAFFILSTEGASKIVADKLYSFRNSAWGQYWDNYYECK